MCLHVLCVCMCICCVFAVHRCVVQVLWCVAECYRVCMCGNTIVPEVWQDLCWVHIRVVRVLQCVAVCCSVLLQCAAVCCSVLRCVSDMAHRVPRACVAVCCSVLLQAEYIEYLEGDEVFTLYTACNTLQQTAAQHRVPGAWLVIYISAWYMSCSVLQCVAVCCSVLQCVLQVVYIEYLQHDEVFTIYSHNRSS